MAAPMLEDDRDTLPATGVPAASDELLLRSAIAVRQAFAPLYERYLDAVFRYCALRLDDRQTAENATSQVISRALDRLPQYRAARGEGTFAGRLFAIARGVVADRQRSLIRGRLKTVPIDMLADLAALGPSTADATLAVIERRAVRSAIAELPVDQRQVVHGKRTATGDFGAFVRLAVPPSCDVTELWSSRLTRTDGDAEYSLVPNFVLPANEPSSITVHATIEIHDLAVERIATNREQANVQGTLDQAMTCEFLGSEVQRVSRFSDDFPLRPYAQVSPPHLGEREIGNAFILDDGREAVSTASSWLQWPGLDASVPGGEPTRLAMTLIVVFVSAPPELGVPTQIDEIVQVTGGTDMAATPGATPLPGG